MSSHDAARNLLYGVLALQHRFIDRQVLVAAFDQWGDDKTRALADLLVAAGQLSTSQRELLDGLVEHHLKLHAGDPQQSLQALSSVDSAVNDLRQLADPDLQRSLDLLPGVASDPFRTAPQMEDSSSSVVRFKKLRFHARGGLGEVHVAEDQELHREVALKEIQASHADDPHKQEKFKLEAEITGGLEHPGIVPVYGLGTYADGRPFYAMRFIKGDSLQDAIRRYHADQAGDVMKFRQLLRRFLDVCNAMQYAHDRGVLHRDLKPGNIMLGKYGETMVVDWGLAKAQGQVEGQAAGDERPLRPATGSHSAPTQQGVLMGTPAYMSPEQAKGEIDLLGPATDVYSLGATLYHLLTGQAAFTDSEPDEVLQKVRRGEFPRPSQIKSTTPKPLEAVCLKAMSLKPADRYTNARELAEEIEHWLADEPVMAYCEPLRDRTRRWVRKHPGPVTGLAATVVLGLLAAGTLAYLNGKHAQEVEGHLQTANAARQRADTNLELASELENALLASTLGYDPTGLRGSNVPTGRSTQFGPSSDEQARQADQRIRGKLRPYPALLVRYLVVQAHVNRSRGEYDVARALLQEARTFSGSATAEELRLNGYILCELGWIELDCGNFREAAKLTEEALTKFTSGNADELILADAKFNLAWAVGCQAGLETDHKDQLVGRSRDLFEEVLATRTQVLGERHRDVGIVHGALAALVAPRDRASAILHLGKAAVAFNELDANDPLRLILDYLRADMTRYVDKKQAARQIQAVLKRAEVMLGDSHPYYSMALGAYAGLQRDLGDIEGANSSIEKALSAARRSPAKGHPYMIRGLNEFAEALVRRGELEKAKPLFEEALEYCDARKLAQNDKLRTRTMRNLESLEANE